MRVREKTVQERYMPRLFTLEYGAIFRLEPASNILMIMKEIPVLRDSKCPCVDLITGLYTRENSSKFVYPCDGEFVEAGAKGSNIQAKDCTVHNIHNESGDAFRKANPQGIRRESGTVPGGGKYDMTSIDYAPAFKKKLAELMKANPKAAMELKRAGVIIDEYSTLENAGISLEEAAANLKDANSKAISGTALDKAINKTWDEAKETDQEAAKAMAKEHIDKTVRFTGTMEEFKKYIEPEGSDDDPASECLKKVRLELKALKLKNLSPEEEKAESFRIISQFGDKKDEEVKLPREESQLEEVIRKTADSLNPHWCQHCGRIHCPEPDIIPGNPDKAYKPIHCPAGVSFDDRPRTGDWNSSCDFWVPCELHAGDYRCPKCHAVLIETTPGELSTMPVCPTCDSSSGYIDMSKIHDESNHFIPPEPYVEDEETEESAPGLPESEQPFNIEALLSTLLPCPECKSIKVLELQSNQTSGAHNVFCQMCAYVGPIGKDEKETVSLWNELDRPEE